MDEESIYVYVCGVYSTDTCWALHTLGIYRNEKDAINKIISSCKDEYSFIFGQNNELDFESITSYDQVEPFMKKYSLYYYHEETHFLYIERVKLE